tara:strand:- start:794 stop:1087 length:294 start_codon:yes stop_codon:yes gene_type:complete
MKHYSRFNRRRFINKNKIKNNTMGNVFIKKRKVFNNENTDLYKSLLKTNINEKLIYLEEKLDRLDDKIYVLEQHTKANLIVISNDIHLLYDRLPPKK